ncbi:AAA family ATPase [Mycolicibacterium elephantis]
MLDQPDEVPAVWGHGSEVLWAEGESLMIAGPQGVGKTTLVGQLIRALVGLGDGHVLGMPVKPLAGPVLYLAMDRPRQIARALRRQSVPQDRAILDERLLIRPGPPPADLAAQPHLLATMARDLDVSAVFIDSVKDAALGLSNDEVGAAYNRARQLVIADGRQFADAHHVVKRRADGGPVRDINDIYGSTWLTSGCGSVVLLSGEPGDPVVEFRHLKQPAGEVGPWRLMHDATTGRLSVEHQVDLLDLVRAKGPEGLTAKDAATAVFRDPDNPTKPPTRAEKEKARRRLDGLVAEGVLTRMEGSNTSDPSLWFDATGGVTGGHEK